MIFPDRVDADRRLIILRALDENGGAASEAVLETALLALGERIGVDRDYVRRQLKWLAEADLVVNDLYRERVMVGEITKRGVALIERRIKVDGVSSPSRGI